MLTPRTRLPFISIAVPVMNEEKAIPFFVAAITQQMTEHDYQYEIIFVDDGSTDTTLQILARERARNPNIKYVSLSRNFGKEIATTAALDHTRGDVVIPMDVDMQDPPALIHDMIAEWQRGYDVVLAKRENRSADGWLKRTSANAFYYAMQRIAGVNLPQQVGDFRLMDAKVVQVIRGMRERTRFMKGILSWPGFTTTTLTYTRPPRADGSTRWNYRKLWKLALDGVFSFSDMPLKVWTYIGASVALISLLYASFIILRTLVFGVDVPGYASLMTVILFMGGIQLISLGVIGEYVARIYNEAKQRPLYAIRDTAGIEKP